MVVDALAEKYQATFKSSAFEAEIAEFFMNGEKSCWSNLRLS